MISLLYNNSIQYKNIYLHSLQTSSLKKQDDNDDDNLTKTKHLHLSIHLSNTHLPNSRADLQARGRIIYENYVIHHLVDNIQYPTTHSIIRFHFQEPAFHPTNQPSTYQKERNSKHTTRQLKPPNIKSTNL